MPIDRRHIAPLALAAIGALSHPAAAQERAWGVSGSGSFVVATDCRDCIDDVGIVFECRGLGRPADVTVPAAVVDRRPPGARHRVEFFVDGLGMAYNAEIERQGLDGFMPKLRVRQDDPLVARLAGGSSLRVVFAGRSSDISLQGARAALAAFASQCAWRIAKDLARPLAAAPPDEPRVSSTPTPGTPAPGPRTGLDERPGLRWQFFTGGGGEPSRLVFGVPGTDSAVLVATCLPGATRALVELPDGPSDLEPGRSVEVGIHTSRGIKGVSGVVSQSAQASFPSDPNGLLWSTLRAGGVATFSVAGRPAGFVESGLAERAITNFLTQCR